MDEMTTLIGGGCLVAGGLLGAAACHWFAKRRASEKVRLPGHWPLRLRGLVNANEKVVWAWLRKTFPDHVVMVKVPILRFTMLIDEHDSSSEGDSKLRSDHVAAHASVRNEKWIELLNTVYSSFTVCTTNGRVVGCVDVLGNSTLTRGNRELKELMFLDSGVAYLVVNLAKLPEAVSIRFAFLGEQPAIPVKLEVTHGGDSEFREELDAFTKPSRSAPL